MAKQLKNNVIGFSRRRGSGQRPEWDLVRSFLGQQHAPATRKMYRSSFGKFARWCEERGLEPLPASPETVAMFLAAEAESGMKPSTIARHTAAIRHHHIAADHPDPTRHEVVRSLKKGIKRAVGTAPIQKQPATVERLTRMVEASDDTPRGLRDRAILLLGFAGAFRRSELARLRLEDLEFLDEGLRVRVRRSKTDQEAQGQVVYVASGTDLCPIRAVLDWIEAVGIEGGSLFRRINKGGTVMETGLTGHAIGNLVKACAVRAGFEAREFAGHSLRSGFLTAAAQNGASVWKMMEVSRHQSLEAVQGYVRAAEGFQEHAGAGLL